ncbi:MAG: hypothetical protein ACRCVW_03035 [Brevinema sp.]
MEHAVSGFRQHLELDDLNIVYTIAGPTRSYYLLIGDFYYGRKIKEDRFNLSGMSTTFLLIARRSSIDL